MIGRQFQRRDILELVQPVTAQVLQYVAGQPFALPNRVIGVLDLQFGQGRRKSRGIGLIRRDQFSTELEQERDKVRQALEIPRAICEKYKEAYWEIAREGDRLLYIYRAKASRDIGRKFDGGILSPKAVMEEQAEWLDRFERALLMARLAPALRRRHND